MKSLLLLFLYLVNATNIGTLLHLSDIHLDLYYKQGSATDCWLGTTGLGCCRETSLGTGVATKWGSYNCDTSSLFANATLAWLSTLKNIDAVIWTGDIVDHHDLTQTWPRNKAEVTQFSTWLSALNIPIFPVLGNHDTYPIDQLYPSFSTVLEDVYATWHNFNINTTFNTTGYYTFSFTEKIRVIGLNSLFWDKNNLAIKRDYYGELQFAFLINCLEIARHKHETVWILQHIAPGSGEAIPTFATRYQTIIANYTDLQIVHFAGHSHDDEFRLLHDSKNNTIGVIFIPLSMKADFHYPGIRKIYYDRNTGILLDYEQYWLNWTAQLASDQFVGFQLGYTASSAYELQNLSYQQMDNLVQRFKHNTTLLNKYYIYNNPNTTLAPCNQECQNYLLCNMEWVDNRC